MKPLKHSHKKTHQPLQEALPCNQWFVIQHLDEVFDHEQYRQRIPVLDYSYSVKAGKPFIYFRNLSPIIIN